MATTLRPTRTPRAPITTASNLPCELCDRRGWQSNPVLFRKDVPGHVCTTCHREHVASRVSR